MLRIAKEQQFIRHLTQSDAFFIVQLMRFTQALSNRHKLITVRVATILLNLGKNKVSEIRDLFLKMNFHPLTVISVCTSKLFSAYTWNIQSCGSVVLWFRSPTESDIWITLPWKIHGSGRKSESMTASLLSAQHVCEVQLGLNSLMTVVIFSLS